MLQSKWGIAGALNTASWLKNAEEYKSKYRCYSRSAVQSPCLEYGTYEIPPE
jgi:hypothetical protein